MFDEPEALNPVKQLRKEYSLTMESVALHAQVSRQTVLRTEQGTFTDIPPKLLAWFEQNFPYYSVKDLPHDYLAWQEHHRRINYGSLILGIPHLQFGTLVPIENLFPVGEHPFTWWRNVSGLENTVIIGKLYCIHLSTLSKFESSLPPSVVPAQLTSALRSAGYPNKVLEGLSVAYQEFYRQRQASFMQAQPVNVKLVESLNG